MKIIVTHHNRVGPVAFTFTNVEAAAEWMQTLLRNRVDFDTTYEEE